MTCTGKQSRPGTMFTACKLQGWWGLNKQSTGADSGRDPSTAYAAWHPLTALARLACASRLHAAPPAAATRAAGVRCADGGVRHAHQCAPVPALSTTFPLTDRGSSPQPHPHSPLLPCARRRQVHVRDSVRGTATLFRIVLAANV